MHALRTHHIALAWLACLSVLLAALAPAVSHGLQARGNAQWAEVCTAAGSALVRVDATGGDQTAPPLPGSHLLQHCPYCSLHAPDLALPPAPACALQAAAAGEEAVAPQPSVPPSAGLWARAQPRAPPRS
jgi:Protein of unknown function (DUF2946)